MGDPIRILHVVVNMNRGGAETLIMNLYRNIDRTKVQFDFLTCKTGAFDSEIEALGGNIYRIPYITDVGHFGYIKAMDQFFTAHPTYRIVHAHMDKMSGFVLRSAKRAGIPKRIAHSHNTSSEGGIATKTYKWVAGEFIRPSATHLLACSNKAAQWLFAGQQSKATILKNGIECEQFAFSSEVREQVRRELKLTNDSYVIGHVGRFNHQKNHSFLVDVFAEMTNQQPDSILILAGDGPLRPEIEQKGKKLGLTERVRFLGIRSDITRLLQAFDVFVFPSWHEGLPVTLIEAQGAGLPCIISDTITKEVDLGIELVDYISLSDLLTWVTKIRNIRSSNRSRHISDHCLSSKGYDIRNTAEWAKDFYLGLAR